MPIRKTSNANTLVEAPVDDKRNTFVKTNGHCAWRVNNPERQPSKLRNVSVKNEEDVASKKSPHGRNLSADGSMTLKEQFFALKRSGPARKTQPLFERERPEALSDVSGGLFPTAIPIRRTGAPPQNVDELLASPVIYCEELEFTAKAWNSLEVLRCSKECFTCRHFTRNSTTRSDAGDTASCDCEVGQTGCRRKHCIFSSNDRIITSTKAGKIIVSEEDNQPRVFECGLLCSCVKNCERGILLKGPNTDLKLELRYDGDIGWSVYTRKSISANTYLFDYVGLVNAEDEAKVLSIESDYLFTNGDMLAVDAGLQGNVARWINHSCVPNCVVLFGHVGHTYSGFARLVIVTNRHIDADEALSYDYGEQWWRSQYKAKNLICLCGSSVCRFTKKRLQMLTSHDDKAEKKPTPKKTPVARTKMTSTSKDDAVVSSSRWSRSKDGRLMTIDGSEIMVRLSFDVLSTTRVNIANTDSREKLQLMPSPPSLAPDENERQTGDSDDEVSASTSAFKYYRTKITAAARNVFNGIIHHLLRAPYWLLVVVFLTVFNLFAYSGFETYKTAKFW